MCKEMGQSSSNEKKGFDAVYFVYEDMGWGNMKVKYGDTRSESKNEGNYRGKANAIKVHGNSTKRSVGKYLQTEVLDRLVGMEMAKQIGRTEEYIVEDKICRKLVKNWEEHTKRNYLSNEEIERIAKQEVCEEESEREKIKGGREKGE